MLQGVITAMVTPMFLDGRIDWNSLANLVDHQISANVAGLVLSGTTGEAATLSVHEKLELINYTIKYVKGRLPIIVGVNDISTEFALDTISMLNQASGIDYLLVVVPMYVKPTQEGIYQHFLKIAQKSQKPIILYNVPGRTASYISDETVSRLMRASNNIVGIKDASGDVDAYRLLNNRQKYSKDFALYSGDDQTAVDFILHGGHGVISVISNLIPHQVNQMINAAILGKNDIAITGFNKMKELIEVLFIESNPIPLKWLLASEGIISSPYLRLPLTILSDDYKIKVADALLKFKRG